ncbi:acetate kinase [Sulfurimicrobium lacus]|uniref:Acetate kinase n=1 Tax=Sulfurimicrobium lacus TaxID=2715678 RepID=A0A6F8VEE5_9PROT|nr:acetate kinase [Sulfurimicrobium lacus]BCB28054.1 acetate kinase [Sulfurimicrobium lacus]
MPRIILTINSGSSSLKASLFRADGTRRNFRYEHIGQGFPHDHAEAFDQLMKDLGGDAPDAVGHRFVHGGDITDPARFVDAAELARLESIVHLAPLHMPGNILGVALCRERFDVPQVACFDTAFHVTMPELSKRLPIPRNLGMRRYGFHGINYSHVARSLPAILGEAARGRVVVAHLGSGASLCLLENLQSVDTSMGYTPAGGIPMGTRSGDLDPGVMLELAKRYNADELADLVYHRMGLIALSAGEDCEMSALIGSKSADAHFAVQYFCRQVRAAIGAFAAKAGGIDALVFTGGIGEHSPPIRAAICDPLAFLGFRLDEQSNSDNEVMLAAMGSKPVLNLAADEEKEIGNLVRQLLETERT